MNHGLAFVTTCMGRLSHLRQSLPRLASQPGADCIVVDYSCPEQSGEWALANLPGTRVVRVEGESCFNLARARNAGAAVCDADWICFIDADVLIQPSFSAEVAELLKPGAFYRPDPFDALTWGTVIVARNDFERIGGYDDIIQGWGGEDDDLYARLQMAGSRPAGFPGRLMAGIDHGEIDRVKHYAIKDRLLSQRINALYIRIKADMSRLVGMPVPPDIRRSIYSDLNRIVPEADAQRTSARMNIDLAQLPFLHGRTLGVRMEYTLSAESQAVGLLD